MNIAAVFRRAWKRLGIRTPEFHVVLGSGLGDAFHALPPPKGWMARGELPFAKVPGLGSATAPGHHGLYRFYEYTPTGRVITLQFGRLHGYEGNPPRQVVQTVLGPALAGTRNFILTNAAGSLTPRFQPGSVMLLRDHVNLTGQNPLTGPNPVGPTGAELGPRFPDMTRAYDPRLRRALGVALKRGGVRVHEGVYLGLAGPNFETAAEVALFRRWGLQAVGMSTVWEAIALTHFGAARGLRLAAFSLISNLGAGLGAGQPLTHAEVLETGRAVSAGIAQSLFAFLADAALAEPTKEFLQAPL